MLKIKMNIAEALSEAIKKYFSVDAAANDIYELLEYPPDKEMGDIALPCFKLSKTLRLLLSLYLTRCQRRFPMALEKSHLPGDI